MLLQLPLRLVYTFRIFVLGLNNCHYSNCVVEVSDSESFWLVNDEMTNLPCNSSDDPLFVKLPKHFNLTQSYFCYIAISRK